MNNIIRIPHFITYILGVFYFLLTIGVCYFNFSIILIGVTPLSFQSETKWDFVDVNIYLYYYIYTGICLASVIQSMHRDLKSPNFLLAPVKLENVIHWLLHIIMVKIKIKTLMHSGYPKS